MSLLLSDVAGTAEVLWVPYKNYLIFAVALHHSNVSGLENLFVVVSLSIKIKIKVLPYCFGVILKL